VENTAGENGEEDSVETVAKEILAAQNVAGAETHESAWDISWDFPEKKRKEFVLGFNGGIMPGSSAGFSGPSIMASSSHNGSGQHSYIIEQVSDAKYSLPLNLGVQMQFQVGENLALGVGLNYTMLKSKFDCLVNKVRYSGKQTLHYIGLPVNVYGIIADKNNFTFYLNGGAMIEKGLKANYEFHSYMDSHSYSEDIDGVQLSFNAGMGVEYKLTKYAGIYFEPNVVYFIYPDMQYCIRTDQPLQIKGELGCRFHF
jgi:opacity protein-like surface antigen